MPKDALTFAGDESGDASFRFDRGATRHFVIAIVGTNQPDTLREALRQLRRQYSLPPQYEFSFHKTTSTHLRTVLWETLPQLDFRVWAVIADKERLPDAFLTMHPRAFYVFFATEAIRLIPEPEREGGILLLDEFDRSGKTLAEVKRTLKLRHIPRGLKKIRACRSRSEDLVQIADLVAGAVLRRYAKGGDRAYRALEPKVQVLLEFWKQKTPLTSSDSVI
jgi:hypothetical protein